MSSTVRRVVTGHDSSGRSVVLWDGPAKRYDLNRPGLALFDLWRTTETPAPVAATEADPVEVPLDFDINKRGVRMRLLELPATEPGTVPYLHRTESIDYGFVLEGEMCLLLDGQEVVLNKGDCVIQRGTNHAWINRSDQPCRMLFVMIGGTLSPELKNLGGLFSPEDMQKTLTTTPSEET